MNGGKKIRILFFISRLAAGGKERRLIELLTYLKKNDNFQLMMLLTHDQIDYPAFYKLDIPYKIVRRGNSRYDLSIFSNFYKICKQFRPNLIHTWGSLQSFYTLPAVIGQRIPLVNSQITGAPPNLKKWSVFRLIEKINFHFSKIVLSNSHAGIDIYNPPLAKSKVIYNGMNMDRFEQLPPVSSVKEKFGITTTYVVVMSASFSLNKNYDLFFKVAELVTSQRDDITFIGVGFYDAKNDVIYKRMLELSKGKRNIIFPGKIDDVEALFNACTVGVLFSNTAVHGEGISNSILEYMALGKPVIANDAGGTKEIVHNDKNGYLITNENTQEIAAILVELVDNERKRSDFGQISKRMIEELFSLNRMGQAFEEVYNEALE